MVEQTDMRMHTQQTLVVVTRQAELAEMVGRYALLAGWGCEVMQQWEVSQELVSPAAVVLIDAQLAPELQDQPEPPTTWACSRERSTTGIGPPERTVVLVRRGDSVPAADWRYAATLGAEHVVALPAAHRWLEQLLRRHSHNDAGPAMQLGVVGACGGAGASSFAAALAVALSRRGQRTLLLDADPLGGGVDLFFGGEGWQGHRWPDFTQVRGEIADHTLRQILPRWQDLTVLSWDRGNQLTLPEPAMSAVHTAAVREFDCIVYDLPRSFPTALLPHLAGCDRIFLLTPQRLRAVAAGIRVLTGYAAVRSRLAAVTRGPLPAGLRAQEVAKALDIPLAAQVKHEPRFAEQLEHGRLDFHQGKGQLAVTAGRVSEALLTERRRRVAA